MSDIDAIFRLFFGLILLALLAMLLIPLAWLARSLLNRMRYRNRGRQVAAVAQRLGLQPDPAGKHRLYTVPFPMLQLGDSNEIENVYSGRAGGMDVTIFDFWYTKVQRTQHGIPIWKSYRHLSCAVAAVDLHARPLTIGRETVWTRLMGRWLAPDIDFELETFNRRFRVECAEPMFAHALLDIQMMNWLLAQERHLHFQAAGPNLLAYRAQLPAPKLWNLLTALRGFHDRVPRAAKSMFSEPPPEPQALQDPLSAFFSGGVEGLIRAKKQRVPEHPVAGGPQPYVPERTAQPGPRPYVPDGPRAAPAGRIDPFG